MPWKDKMSILAIGSVAIDSVETPFGKRTNILGGSATYFSIAASFFSAVDIVAVIGEDFPKRYLSIFKDRGIGIEGLEMKAGKTFRWRGRYDSDLSAATTLATHLNVFNDFRPQIPEGLRNAEVLFLANIDPQLQHSVLNQMAHPRFVGCDSMNYWLNNKRRALINFLKQVDFFLLNDSEARELSGEFNLLKAARSIMSLGPKAVVIKKGEHGVIYFSKMAHFIMPAYLLETVRDPTGAGDTFAGGMFGYLAKAGNLSDANVRKAVAYGSVLASFTVEEFGVKGLLRLSAADIATRVKHFKTIARF
jgi:sugar/nucleoside kinase (ribokinase family)